jgi:hypothetical protein
MVEVLLELMETQELLVLVVVEVLVDVETLSHLQVVQAVQV